MATGSRRPIVCGACRDSADSAGYGEVEIVCCEGGAAGHLALFWRCSEEQEMNCAEAAECVSALFDGEPISRETAAHLSDCEECRARLNDYAEMGAELRDLAGASAPQAIPEGQW